MSSNKKIKLLSMLESEDPLEYLNSELKRLHALDIPFIKDLRFTKVPTVLHHIEQTLGDCMERNQELAGLFALPVVSDDVMLKRKNISSEIQRKLIFLGTIIEKYNESVNNKQEQEKARELVFQGKLAKYDNFTDDYEVSMFILSAILKGFYSLESNHGFAPSKVIDLVDSICVEKGIPFPLDRKGSTLKSYIEASLPKEVKKRKYAGVAKAEYRTIPKEDFLNHYEGFFEYAEIWNANKKTL